MKTYVLYRYSEYGESEITLSCETRRTPNDQNHGYSVWPLSTLLVSGWTVVGEL